MKLQAAKAKEEETRRAQEAEDARRAEQSSAAKRKAKDDMEAAKVQEEAKLAASKAEAEAIEKRSGTLKSLRRLHRSRPHRFYPCSTKGGGLAHVAASLLRQDIRRRTHIRRISL